MVGKRYQEKAFALFLQAKNEQEEFLKALFFHTSSTMYRNAEFFYKQSYDLKDYRMKEEVASQYLESMFDETENQGLDTIHQESEEFIHKDIPNVMKKIHAKIKKLPMYRIYKDTLEEVNSEKSS